MELPIELKEKIEQELSNISIKDLQKSAKEISEKYRDKTKNKVNNRLITSKIDSIAYSASRMPATYASVYNVLQHVKEILTNNEEHLKSLLDVGAGTGSGSWAASSLFNLEEVTCIENEEYMKQVRKKIYAKCRIKNIKRSKVAN